METLHLPVPATLFLASVTCLALVTHQSCVGVVALSVSIEQVFSHLEHSFLIQTVSFEAEISVDKTDGLCHTDPERSLG